MRGSGEPQAAAAMNKKAVPEAQNALGTDSKKSDPYTALEYRRPRFDSSLLCNEAVTDAIGSRTVLLVGRWERPSGRLTRVQYRVSAVREPMPPGR